MQLRTKKTTQYYSVVAPRHPRVRACAHVPASCRTPRLSRTRGKEGCAIRPYLPSCRPSNLTRTLTSGRLLGTPNIAAWTDQHGFGRCRVRRRRIWRRGTQGRGARRGQRACKRRDSLSLSRSRSRSRSRSLSRSHNRHRHRWTRATGGDGRGV